MCALQWLLVSRARLPLRLPSLLCVQAATVDGVAAVVAAIVVVVVVIALGPSSRAVDCQVRAEATAAARREMDAQTKSIEKGREDIRALQDRLAQAQQDNTRQTHLLTVQAAENDQRAAKLAKQEVVLHLHCCAYVQLVAEQYFMRFC